MVEGGSEVILSERERARRNPRQLSIAVVLACVMLTATHSAAAPATKKPILVFEAHVGERTSDVARYMKQLRDRLEAEGFIASPEELVKLVGRNLPLPGVANPGVTAAYVSQLVGDGYDAFMGARFKDAIDILTDVIALIRRNPAVLAMDTSNAHVTFKAHVVLALSFAKSGRAADSVTVMAELIRLFRTQPISSAVYGPMAEQLYRSVAKQVLAMGRGTLSVRVGDPNAMIFVDSQLRGLGRVELGDLIPGRYQVYVQAPGSNGRQYQVEVRPNADSVLEIEYEVDSALQVSESWLGFQFDTDAERGKEARFAGGLARRWVAGDLVAVIGMMTLQGKPAAIGTLYRSDGSVYRSAVANTTVRYEENLRALAQFLSDGTQGEGISILTSPETPASLQVKRGSRSKLWGKLLVAGGTAAVLAGGTLLFVIDEDPCEPTDTCPPQYRDTAPAGIAVGAIGLAAVGVGIWLWARSDGAASTPVVSVGPSHAFVGWTGRF